MSDRELYERIALVSVRHRRHVKRGCEMLQSHTEEKGKYQSIRTKMNHLKNVESLNACVL
jgi:hypothetical protein